MILLKQKFLIFFLFVCRIDVNNFNAINNKNNDKGHEDDDLAFLYIQCLNCSHLFLENDYN